MEHAVAEKPVVSDDTARALHAQYASPLTVMVDNGGRVFVTGLTSDGYQSTVRLTGSPEKCALAREIVGAYTPGEYRVPVVVFGRVLGWL